MVGREGWEENVLNLITRYPQRQACYSVTQSYPTPCDPMNCSTPGLSVPHHLPKFAHGHVYCISDAIQPSHPLTPSSLSALNLSQHQGLFQWVDQWWGLNEGIQQAYDTLPKIWIKTKMTRTSLVVQWLRLWGPDAGDPGSKPGQGTRSHMPQLKIQHSHTSKY